MSLVKQLRANNKKIYPVTTTDAVLFGNKTITNAIASLMADDLSYGVRISSFGQSGSGDVNEEFGNREILTKILDQFRPCVAKGNQIQYYLDPYNLNLKEDGGEAVLDGTAGTVRVHTPSFYGRAVYNTDKSMYEISVSDSAFDETWEKIPEMLIDAYVCSKTERGWESIVNLDQPELAMTHDPIGEMANIPEGSKLVDYLVWKWIFVFLRVLDKKYTNFGCYQPFSPWPYSKDTLKESEPDEDGFSTWTGMVGGVAGFLNRGIPMVDGETIFWEEWVPHTGIAKYWGPNETDEASRTWGNLYDPYRISQWCYFENPDGWGAKILPDVTVKRSDEYNRYEINVAGNSHIQGNWDFPPQPGFVGIDYMRRDYDKDYSEIDLTINLSDEEYIYRYNTDWTGYGNLPEQSWDEYPVTYCAATCPPESAKYVGSCSVTNFYIGDPQYAIDELHNEYSIRTYSLV